MTSLQTLARQAATRYNLDDKLVCALIEQESSWNPWAVRYEPAFFDKYIAHLNLSPTESHARSFSWGLMQVMGQTAREHGYAGLFLSELSDPGAGLNIGCTILAGKVSASRGDIRKALLLYNGGAKETYPDEVLARQSKY